MTICDLCTHVARILFELGRFYLQHADENDCIRAFGGPRPYRYVCEDNLELCSNNKQPLELDEDFNHQEWKWDASRGRYNATAEMKVSLDEVDIELFRTIFYTKGILKICLTSCSVHVC